MSVASAPYLHIRSGDVLLCSNNTATGFLLKSATSSAYNHSAIAIRLHNDEVSITDEGDLYLLELNQDKRFDILSGKAATGMTLTQWEWAMGRYNLMMCRRLRDEYRDSIFAVRAKSFITEHHGASFSQGLSPFLGVWLGVDLAGECRYGDTGKREFFCSEMMAEFYQYVFERSLQDIFTMACPSTAVLYKPAHFSVELSRDSLMFKDVEEQVHVQYCDGTMVLLQPLFIGLLLMLVLRGLLG